MSRNLSLMAGCEISAEIINIDMLELGPNNNVKVCHRLLCQIATRGTVSYFKWVQNIHRSQQPSTDKNQCQCQFMDSLRVSAALICSLRDRALLLQYEKCDKQRPWSMLCSRWSMGLWISALRTAKLAECNSRLSANKQTQDGCRKKSLRRSVSGPLLLSSSFHLLGGSSAKETQNAENNSEFYRELTFVVQLSGRMSCVVQFVIPNKCGRIKRGRTENEILMTPSRQWKLRRKWGAFMTLARSSRVLKML